MSFRLLFTEQYTRRAARFIKRLRSYASST